MTTNEFYIGPSRNNNYKVTEGLVDLTRRDQKKSRYCKIEAEPKNLVIDLSRTALVVIDMQNDFCTEGGYVSELGGNYNHLRKPIDPLNQLIPTLRTHSIPIIWVNWGNRPDRLNLSPSLLYSFNPDGEKGIGDPLPTHNARVLEKDSWSAAIVDELNPSNDDVFVDKYRISGFWDTPLNSILRNLRVSTVMFTGVNADQCVMASLEDASFLGYDCILLEDCVATISPDFCLQATLYNVKLCYGFVTSSNGFLEGLKAPDFNE